MSTIPVRMIILACFVAVVSGAYSFYYHDRPRVDALGYDQIGWNLARGYGYVEDSANSAHPENDWGINRVGPGYEFFLAGIYTLFGHHIWPVWILHALVRGGSVLLLFLLTRLLFPASLGEPTMSKIAFLAAVLFGFSPDLIVVNGLLLTETLFLGTLIGALLLSVHYLTHGRRGYVFFAGLLWAFAILIRLTALLPFLLMLGVLMWKKDWHAGIAFVLFPIILVGSWSVFASLRYDRFILTTGVGAYDLWVGNNPQAKGGFEKAPEVQRARDTYSSKELDQIAKKKYVEFLVSEPLQFLELQIRKTAIYFSMIRPGGFWIHLWGRPWHLRATLFASILWVAIVFPLGLAGALLFFRDRKDITARLFLAFAFLQPATVIPVIVETRYRYALFPFLVIFTAYFLATKPYSKKIFSVALFVLAFFAGYDLVSNFHEIYGKVSIIFRL